MLVYVGCGSILGGRNRGDAQSIELCPSGGMFWPWPCSASSRYEFTALKLP